MKNNNLDKGQVHFGLWWFLIRDYIHRPDAQNKKVTVTFWIKLIKTKTKKTHPNGSRSAPPAAKGGSSEGGLHKHEGHTN